ncbi:MAG: hypothetical protein LUO93_00705 [Methanomicrobiales archaeon]|nr:hypothetical protein [Methanomicrobiales archaeon]
MSDEIDPLEEFVREVGAAQELVKKSQASSENVKAHMHGTILPLLIKLATVVAQSRDGTLDYVDGRLALIEGEETQIVGEDAEKLLALIEGTAWLVGELRKSITDATAVLRLDELEKMAAECKEIVEEARVEEEDDEQTDPAKVN